MKTYTHKHIHTHAYTPVRYSLFIAEQREANKPNLFKVTPALDREAVLIVVLVVHDVAVAWECKS
jgi:hypothetical protein